MKRDSNSQKTTTELFFEAAMKLEELESRQFPGAKIITPPSKYPATDRACWRAILGRSPSLEELKKAKQALVEAGVILSPEGLICYDKTHFWKVAKLIVPHLFRYRKFYPEVVLHRREILRAKRSGRFTKIHRGANGRFEKKPSS